MASLPIRQAVRHARRALGLAEGDDGVVRLSRWFALTGAVAIGAFSVGMGSLLSGLLGARLLERDAAISRDFVQSVMRIERLSGGASVPTLRAPVAGNPSPVDSPALEFFSHLAAMPDVIRANVYSPQGRVLWSSQGELIGRDFGLNPELDAALAGRLVVHLESHDHAADGVPLKPENQDLAQKRIPFVESYMPLYDRDGRGPIAVVELYRQPAALFDAIADGRRRVMAGSLAGGVLMFALLAYFVRRTEAELRDRQRRLVEAETLAVVGEVSAAVAHSIRNPLGSIRSSAELQVELGADAQGLHAETIHHVDRIEHLVRTMLTCASNAPGRQGPADLSAVLRSAAQTFEPDLHQHGVGLELNLAEQLGSVRADPVLLQQVFNSLLANAAEAVRQGGRVSLLARKVGHMALVEVRDTGPGIPAEKMRDVFKPFYTTKPRGLGLGLPLARRIVRRVGGDLIIDSTPGQGTRVRVEFPLEVR